jgi:hypothetical protein
VRYVEPLLFGLNLKAEVFLMQHLEDTRWHAHAPRHAPVVRRVVERAVLAGAPERSHGARRRAGRRSNATTAEAGFDADRAAAASSPGRVSCRGDDEHVFKRITERPEGSSKATQLLGRAVLGQPATGSSAGAKIGSRRAPPDQRSDRARCDLDRGRRGDAARLSRGEFRSRAGRSRARVRRLPTARGVVCVVDGVLYRPFLDSLGVPQSETLYRIGYGVGIEAPVSVGRLALTLGYGQGDGPLDGKIHLRLTSRF